MTAPDYIGHIEQLAEELGVRVVKTRNRNRAVAISGERLIKVPGINNQQDYFTALHELGHIALIPQHPTQLVREANAWEWAIDKALVEPSALTRKDIGACLASYAAGNVGKAQPSPDHGYWKMLGWHEPPRKPITRRRLP